MKATVKNKVNQTVKNFSHNTEVYANSFLQLARMCKERQYVSSDKETSYNISQENYDKIKEILRLTGNEDIPVSAYVEAVLIEFQLTHDEKSMKEFADEIIERRKQ